MIARLNLGGPAHHTALLSGRRFDPERFETLLVHGSLAPGEDSAAYLAEQEGATLVSLPQLVQPVSPYHDARALIGLTGIARRFRPHIVDTHTAKAGFVGRTSALLASRPRPAIVHTYHGHVLEGYFGPAKTQIYRRTESALARISDCLIGVSAATVDDLVRLGVAPRERFRVVPLGLELGPFAQADPSARDELRAELAVSPEEVLFAYVGRLVPIKRLDLLIRAFARAGAEAGSMRLLIAGDGEIRADLEKLAKELKVAGLVHFLGYRRDVTRIAAAADVAGLSSENEGTPVWLIEAAAAARPAVTTSVGGVPEVVTPDTGVLVPPGDESALAAGMARLARDPQLRRAMGERARERALQRFSSSRLIADMTDLYESLVGVGDPR